MRKTISILLVFISSLGWAQTSHLLSGTNQFRVIKSSQQGIEFQLDINNLKTENLVSEFGSYYRLLSNDLTPSLAEGMPEILLFNRLMEVPQNADIQITIIEKEEITIDLNDKNINGFVFPHQLSAPKIKGAKVNFIKDAQTYALNKFYSQPLIQTTYLGQMRHVRLARVTVSPISYNPVSNQIKLVTKIRVALTFVNGDVEKTIAEKRLYFSPAFNFVSAEIINPRAFAVFPDHVSNAAERMVIVLDSNMKKTIMPFVNMKERHGFDVRLAYLQNPLVGSSLTSIKSYLQTLYNNPSTTPTYVILVGDVAQIPAHTGLASSGHITDLYYFEYTNDDFPEILYGRFSCEDTVELANIIEKTIEYEDFLMPDPSYLDTTVLIAGYDNNYGPTHGNGQVNYAHSVYYNGNNGIVPLVYLYPGSSAAAPQIRADASRGAGMLNYSAHGNYNGWEDPIFKNIHVPAMTNIHKYPVMIGNACLTGTFNMNDCFGEVLTNAEKKGAVGYIGASNNTYWDEDYYWAVGYSGITPNPIYTQNGQGIFDGIWHNHNEPYNQWSTSLAQIMNKGNMAVTQSGSRVKYYWEVYHCFGDPSLVHYVKRPSPQNPNHQPFIPIGSGFFNVSSTAPYALVSLSVNDTLISSIYADSLGDASLSFNHFSSSTMALLTITAQNKEPYSINLPVLSPNGPFINLVNYSLNDTLGNKNNRADHGETLKLNVSVNNLTSFVGSSVKVKISTLDSSIIITDSLAFISQFIGFDTVNLINEFEFIVKNHVEDGLKVKIQLHISDSNGGAWSYNLVVPLFAPKIQLSNFMIDDASYGNGNGVADPGETIRITVDATNIGSNTIKNIYGSLLPATSLLLFGAGPYPISELNPNGNQTMSFLLVVSAGATLGAYCPVNVKVSNPNYITEKTFYVVVGNCDEDFETKDFNKFDWQFSGDLNWSIDSLYKNGGMFSAKSGQINNNSTSSFSLNMNVLMEDSISFYLKTSSETSYDFLEFHVDNLPVGSWSGITDWQRVSFPVKPGQHNFKWVYSKDSYGIGGLDAVWVDDINLPVTDLLSSVASLSSDASLLRVFPNPAADWISIVFNSKPSSQVEISIYNLYGKLVDKQLVAGDYGAGSHSILLNISHLKNGTYLIRVNSDSNQQHTKLIKL